MAALTGIFVGDTLEELQAELVIAKDRVKYGDRTALSGAGKSSSRTFSLSAADHLREVRHALKKLTGASREDSSRTYFDARVRR